LWNGQSAFLYRFTSIPYRSAASGNDTFCFTRSKTDNFPPSAADVNNRRLIISLTWPFYRKKERCPVYPKGRKKRRKQKISAFSEIRDIMGVSNIF
jgi:DNA modification methylase